MVRSVVEVRLRAFQLMVQSELRNQQNLVALVHTIGVPALARTFPKLQFQKFRH